MKRLHGILLGLALIAIPITALACTWYHKIDICHANEGKKGYAQNNVDLDSIIKTSGHDGHADDIIPSFWWRDTDDWMTFENPGVNPHYVWYPGKNWGTAGQDIHKAGCVVPATSPTRTPEPPKHCDLQGDMWYQCSTGAWTYTPGGSADKCWCGGLNGHRVTRESYDCGEHWTYWYDGVRTDGYRWLGFNRPTPVCAIGGGGGECLTK